MPPTFPRVRFIRLGHRVWPFGMVLLSACTLLKKSDAELYGDHATGAGGSAGNVGFAGARNEAGAPSASNAGSLEDAGDSSLGGGGSAGRESGGAAGAALSTGGGGAAGTAGAATTGGGGAGGVPSGGAGGGGGAAGGAQWPTCPKLGSYPVRQDASTGHCFAVVTAFYYGLPEARTACGVLGAGFDLASIRSSAEGDVSSALALSVQGTRLLVGFAQSAGAATVSSNWKWVDGSPDGFDTFVGWAPGEPNDGGNDPDKGVEQCAVFSPGGLADVYCESEAYPLCEGPS